MISKEYLEQLVDGLDTYGFPNCQQDARKVLETIKDKTNGHVVWYKGKIVYYDGKNFRITGNHAVAHTDSGQIIDIAQPRGNRVYENGADYWKRSLNSIRKNENR